MARRRTDDPSLETDIGKCEECGGKGCETAHWIETYAPCPCGCGFDADAMVDDRTKAVLRWKCPVDDSDIQASAA